MINQIIISHENNIAAIVQQDKIQELIVTNDMYQIDDIYIGTVQKIFDSINAAFITLNNYGKSGFIHTNSIKSYRKICNLRKELYILAINQALLVQVIKEPTPSKGPRLTVNIHLTGRYAILIPSNSTICIASTIYDDNERAFLRALGVLIRPSGMGILFKQSASRITEAILIEDVKHIQEQWCFMQKAGISEVVPVLIYRDSDIIAKIIRDFYSKNIHNIVIDSISGLRQLAYYLSQHTKRANSYSVINLRFYKQPICILKKFNIDKAIAKALQRRVELTPGVHISIDASEALTTIDVNSGSFSQSSIFRETALRANCLAAQEISYQLKVRNINGIVIIDFIDMNSYQDQLTLLEYLNIVLKTDRAKPQIIQISELGLIELTRQRKSRSLLELFYTEGSYAYQISHKILSERFIENHSFSHNYNGNDIFFKNNFDCQLKLSKIQNNKQADLFLLIEIRTIPLRLYQAISYAINI